MKFKFILPEYKELAEYELVYYNSLTSEIGFYTEKFFVVMEVVMEMSEARLNTLNLYHFSIFTKDKRKFLSDSLVTLPLFLKRLKNTSETL